MNTVAVGIENGSPGRMVAGFAIGAAFFGGVDGFLIGGVTGAGAGALVGALLGAGMVLLAWRPRPQDAATSEKTDGHAANYMLIWVALFVLTMIEVGVAFLAFSKTIIILILVGLALWKAALVAMYYMHLKYEPRRMVVLALSPVPLAIILVMAVLLEGL